MQLRQKLQLFFITSLTGVIFAVLGFSYNAWRLEITEDNNNIRTAAFEILLQLSEFEQIAYAAHFDQDKQEGNPRKGWVKIGLVSDLAILVSPDVNNKAQALKTHWAHNWEKIPADRESLDRLIRHVDETRDSIKISLSNLR